MFATTIAVNNGFKPAIKVFGRLWVLDIERNQEEKAQQDALDALQIALARFIESLNASNFTPT